MRRAVIAIVDAAHARLYAYQHTDGDAPRLREVRDLVNPGRQGHGQFANTQDRRYLGAVDDHREDHLAELEARFARAVVAELTRIAREDGYAHAIVVASPRMLGLLRGEYGQLAREVELVEIAQDLAWLTSPQLHDHLAAMKLVEPRARAVDARARAPR